MTPESWLKIIQDAKKTAIIQDGKNNSESPIITVYNHRLSLLISTFFKLKYSLIQPMIFFLD